MVVARLEFEIHGITNYEFDLVVVQVVRTRIIKIGIGDHEAEAVFGN